MAVLLTVSETISGSAVADSLAGGGTGVDLGSVVNNQFAPIIDKTLNTGRESLFVRHDAAIDPITDVKFFFQEFGVGTGFGYGGADSAANDIATLITLANASGDSKNNGDGLSGGSWIDQNHKVSTTNQFDFATNGRDEGATSGDGTVSKFGDRGTDYVSLATALPMDTQASAHTSDTGNGGDGTDGFTPSAPVQGQIGITGDSALGNRAHLKFRIYLPNSFSQGGIIQWEQVIAYSFTA